MRYFLMVVLIVSILFLCRCGDDNGPTGVGAEGWATDLGDYVLAFECNCSDPAVAYAVVNRPPESHIVVSRDSCVHWTTLAEGIRGDALVVHPANPDWLYVAGSSLHASRDGGASWFAGNEGLTVNSVVALAIDPAAPHDIYAVGSHPVELYQSATDPRGWERVGDPISSTGYAADMVVAETDSSSVFYIAINDTSRSYVLKSHDHGATWSEVGSGLPSHIEAIEATTNPDGHLFVISYVTLYEFAATENLWQYRSAIPIATMVSDINGFECQQGTGCLLVAVSGYEGTVRIHTLIRSLDGGLTWENARYLP